MFYLAIPYIVLISSIFQVFHGADSDIAWLQRDFGIYVVNMFDTYKAMRVLNYSKFSYQHLVQTCCNHTLDKKFQKADWRLRYDVLFLPDYVEFSIILITTIGYNNSVNVDYLRIS